MKRKIKHVTVLGSGVMGSGIACHLAGIGIKVLLLDIPPKEISEKDKQKGIDPKSKKFRNSIVQGHLDVCLKSTPSPIYDKSFVSRITVGNFEDDLLEIKNSDWIIEVVVERLDIKKSLFEKVDRIRKTGTLITSNTSGIPIHLMSEERSDDFQKHFCGTHFFNPPRYLKLLEVIPNPKTDKEVLDFFMSFGEKFLGKTTVLCRDTPGFIGNRVGVYSMAKIMELAEEIGLTIEEVDSLTGDLLDRPKTGTFKLGDLVGLDTAFNVTKGLQNNLKDDEMIQNLKDSKTLNYLIENKFFGHKANKGFYYKEKDTNGIVNRFVLNYETLSYEPTKQPKLPVVKTAKDSGGLKNRIPILLDDQTKAGELIRKHFASLFAYVSQRIPEISNVLYSIDDAIKTGYAWKYGPFENWDFVGVQKGIDLAEKEGYKVAAWVKEMLASGNQSFYKLENGKQLFYNQNTKTYEPIPGQDAFIILNNIRKEKTIWSNSESALIDLGDGILNFEFRSKMNSLGGGVLEGLHKSIDLAEKDYRGLVIGNQSDNFSVGANLAMVMMMAAEQDWYELNMAVAMFQQTSMKLRYSSIPIIAAPFGMTLGGGCEFSMHSDKIVAAAETYIGLVEVGVGLIPGGGGTKEFTLRALKGTLPDDIKTNRLRHYFMNIATAKVATSAHEAKVMGIMTEKDIIIVNKERQIAEAKRQAIAMDELGYSAPIPEKIKVLGKETMGMFFVGTDQMVAGGYATEHDRLIANKIGYVMTGGNLSEQTEVSEQYLLDLEREAFLSLCGERKTLERISGMLKTGKPLRN